MVARLETMHLTVDAFNTDFKRNLSYTIIGRDLLNCAELHASKRGFGLNDISPFGHSWVLSRLSIEMEKMPEVYEEYSVDTWIENIYRMFTNRNFCIRDSEGNPVGYARSVWAMIDNETRQPLELMNIYGEQFQQFLFPENPCPIESHSRLRPLVDAECTKKHVVTYSDIDYNGHVNSIKYIEHVCNLFSLDFYSQHRLRRVEMAYVAETYYGNTLAFYMKELAPLTYQVEVRKLVDSSETEEVVVRSKLCFE